MAETFNLEVRVKESGGVIGFKVYLEKKGNKNYEVLPFDYNSEGNYWFKKINEYKIVDDTLTVYARCGGIWGAYIACIVLINGAQPSEQNTFYNQVTDEGYSEKDFHF